MVDRGSAVGQGYQWQATQLTLRNADIARWLGALYAGLAIATMMSCRSIQLVVDFVAVVARSVQCARGSPERRAIRVSCAYTGRDNGTASMRPSSNELHAVLCAATALWTLIEMEATHFGAGL
jgi:hypothetical protein